MAIIKCPECGHQISETATVCPSCGEKIAGNIVKCAFCGEVYFKDDGICPRCYRSLPQGEHNADKTPSSEASSVENNNDSQDNLPAPATNDAEVHKESEKEELESEQMEEQEDDSEADDAGVPPMEEEEEFDDDDETTNVLPRTDNKDDDSESSNNSDDADDESYIDIDDEQLEKPVHNDEGTSEEEKSKHKYIPVVVSLAIAALIAAVSLYFYNASKLDNETRAYDIAIASNDVKEMQSFLRNYPDATSKHKKEIQDKIDYINKHSDDLSFIMVRRDKERILQFLTDYPDTPKKQTLLAMVDSIDWEDAQKLNTKEAYEHYLETHSDGLFAKDAKDRIAIKIVATNEEDVKRAKSLFREFFLSVNGNESSRLIATLNNQMTSFMGTTNPSNGDVVAWMNRQHKDDVSNVIWKLNHDYKITKREQNNIKESTVDFTASQTIKYKDGRTKTENYKVTTTVTEQYKISSMSMTKYVPKPGEQATSSSSSGSSSAGNSKPSGSQSQSKPSGSQSQSKPSGSQSQSKPSGSQSQSKPSGSQSKPSGSQSQSKPSGSQSKPSGSQSKPSGSQSKPKPSGSQSSQNKTSGSQSKPSNGAKK